MLNQLFHRISGRAALPQDFSSLLKEIMIFLKNVQYFSYFPRWKMVPNFGANRVKQVKNLLKQIGKKI